ncbi:hypothetical protein INT48_008961 [Thamnidium elegans]|uniref:Ubiquitin-like domain-containing protein n=1 Tax=Thamnidium elegans TaxID=101142 RepID=A0A8H7SVB2_9FUNG|nr:hypothetical protein INT48_008961 [Thamnidium elegans]
MSNFDITKLRGKDSFAASLQKRKALGLIDSDSEDENPKRKPKRTKPVQPSKTVIEDDIVKEPIPPPSHTNINIPNEFETKLSETNEYIAAAEALIAQSNFRQTQSKPTAAPISPEIKETKNISLIELSDEDDDDVVVPGAELEDLDPELEAYLKESADSNQSQPLKVTMRLQYTHNFTNISGRAMEMIQTLMKPVKNEQFHKVLESYCNKKGLKKSDVVLTYKDDVVFLSGTPAGLGMNDIEIHNMNVYPIQCYNAMLAEKEKIKLERLKKYNSTDQFEMEESLPPIEENNNNDVEKIMLKLRGKDNKDITLRIRPTATLASLLQYYKQFAQVTGDFNLSFEGELMDLNQTIEQTDLEDEDLIEVV